MGMRQDVIIIDLDGTLCNTRHRDHLAQAGEWEEFHSLLHHDEIFEDVRHLLRMIPWEDTVLAITGRTERWRQPTLQWFRDHDIAQHIDILLMRPDDDFSKAADLKIRLLSEWLLGEEDGTPIAMAMDIARERVKFALDDREKVIDAYRAFGIPCWQVRAGVY